MTHITEPGSKRDTILYTIDNLTPAELTDAKTTADGLYKVANPNSGLNLDIELAARLDAALTARGKCCVFQNLFLKTYEEALGTRKINASEVGTELRHVTVEVGELAGAVDRAESGVVDRAESGGVWTPTEFREVGGKFGDLARKAQAARDHCNRMADPTFQIIPIKAAAE